MGSDSDERLVRFRFGGGEYAVLSVASPVRAVGPLTAAESRVAALIFDGRSNREIAKLRKSSERTVANQVSSLFRKLGVGSRAELVALLGDKR